MIGRLTVGRMAHQSGGFCVLTGMRKTTIEYYQDKKGEWRWRMRRVGRIVADSGEGYVRWASANHSVKKLIESFKAGAYAEIGI